MAAEKTRHEKGDSGRRIDAVAEEAIQTIQEVRKLLEGASREDLAARAATVREKLDAALGSLEEAAARREATLGESIAHGRETLQHEIDAAEKRIRENPIGSVLVAAGIGYLIGRLFGHGR
jgi:ElaB/YqjD/DUF883 family membrane-anchored ribosome-binding protein